MFADQFENLANLRAHYATGESLPPLDCPSCHACCARSRKAPSILGSLHNVQMSCAAGSEILAQTGGRLDAFVCGAGTGGTIAGVSHVLKQHDPRIRVLLVDPPGSSLYNKVWLGLFPFPQLN